MRWCCPQFEMNAYADRPGFSVVAFEDSAGRHFVIRVNATDLRGAALESIEPPAGRIILESVAYIHCCPWCGKRLSAFYRGDGVGELLGERPVRS